MIVVFYMCKSLVTDLPSSIPCFRRFEDAEFMEAMKLMEILRNEGFTHVCMSTELAGSIGKPGVDTVHEGKTPDGHEYDWSKKHRGAGPERLTAELTAPCRCVYPDNCFCAKQ